MILIFLCCLVGTQDVPHAIYWHGVGHLDGHQAALPAATCAMGQLHRAGRGSCGRSQTFGSVASSGDRSSARESQAAGWQPLHRSAGITCGVDLWPHQAYPAHYGGRRLGQMDGHLSVHRQHSASTTCSSTTSGGRPEAEDDQRVGPGGQRETLLSRAKT